MKGKMFALQRTVIITGLGAAKRLDTKRPENGLLSLATWKQLVKSLFGEVEGGWPAGMGGEEKRM